LHRDVQVSRSTWMCESDLGREHSRVPGFYTSAIRMVAAQPMVALVQYAG